MALLLGSDLAGAMQNYPELAKAIAQHLAVEYIESASETLSLRVPCSSSQKLAALILRISKIGSSGLPACQSAYTYTHAELGQLIGASRETVTRLMKLLQRKGVIAARKSTFRITNQRLLREIAEPG
jgi:CRP-like cAMP-binding protein